jgi:phosphohistidine phosphatase
VPLFLNLLRHGEAAPTGTGGDAARPLAARGEQTIRKLSQRLARDGWSPDVVFSSPLRRARDTALILTRGLGLEPPIVTLTELKGEAEPESVVAALAARGASEGQILLVGHQPQLGLLAGHLTGTVRVLTAGELVRIECPEGALKGTGSLVLAIRPHEPGG